MTQRQVDINGYITIPKNPISKVGVFPYLGKTISSQCEPDRIYYVYRPAEELRKPETINSFKHIPIVDDHTMLGTGQTPAERKGVDGVTGADVYLDGDTLFADLHLYSETLLRKIDSGEKKELSVGYRVGKWEKASGLFNGQPYDYIQREIMGNHTAVVKAGRCGSEVAVQDNSMVYDHMDIIQQDTASDSTASPAAEKHGDADSNNANDGAPKMADEKEEKKMTMDDVKAFMKGHAKDRKTFDKLMDEMRPEEAKAEDADTEEKPGDEKLAKDMKACDEDEKKDDKKAEDADEDEKKKDAMDAAITGLRNDLAEFKKNGMKMLTQELNKRNELAKTVEAQFGTFALDGMDTAAEVAAYGLKKAGVKAPTGAEIATWEAYNAGRQASIGARQTGMAMDHRDTRAPVGSLIEKSLNASK